MDAVLSLLLAPLAMIAGFWFILIVGGFFLLAGCFAYNDDELGRGIFIAILATIVWFVVWPNSWSTFTTNLVALLTKGLPLYFGIGILWSFWKWFIALRAWRTTILQCKQRYKDSNIDFHKHLSKELDSKLHLHVPTFEIETGHLHPSTGHSKNKQRIINWICFWPLSVINYVFARLLKDLLDLIVENLGWAYKLLASAVLRGL